MVAGGGKSDATLIEAFGLGWNRFWFTPAEPLPACVLRIVVGLIAAAHFASLSPDLDRWYASDGLLSPTAVQRILELSDEQAHYRFSYLTYFSSGEIRAVHFAAIIASMLFAIGFLTRITGTLTLVAVLSYAHRVPIVAGHLEPLLTFLVAYLCLAPSGACLSLDSLVFRRRAGTDPLPPTDACQPSIAANIGMRLIQVHLTMFCLMMGLSKLYGDAWWEGNA